MNNYDIVQPISEKPTILLLHGLASSKLDWENLIPALNQAGYPAYALDLLGHGDGWKPVSAEEYGYESFVHHFEDWIEQEGFPSPLVLIGHSLGGYLSLAYALRHPENVKAMVLIAPLYTSRQLSPWMRYVQKRPGIGVRALRAVPGWLIQIGYRFQPPGQKPLPMHVRRQMGVDTLRASPNIFHIMGGLPDLDGELARINVPSLVLWGTRDIVLNPGMFPRLAESLSQASTEEVPSAGHELHRSFPDLVSGRILEFLEEI